MPACFLLALAAAALLPGRQAHAQQFIEGQVENLLSTDTMKVDISGLSGLITGNTHIDHVTVSDPQGVFLTADDLSMSWSPFQLVRSNLSIESLTVGHVTLERMPAGQSSSSSSSSSSGLTAHVGSFRIDDAVLQQAVAGVAARLKVNASLDLSTDPTNFSAKANIDRLDQPGQIALDLGYAPDQNQLTVNVDASEPAGGVVASLLDLPGRPAIALKVNGSGPLSAFMANGQLTVGGDQAATLTARVDRVDRGLKVAASLSVAAQRFVPTAYAQYFKGGTNLDLQMLAADDGTYVIDQGELTSDTVAVHASGTYDPTGSANDLSVSAESRDGSAIPFAFGTPPSQARLQVARVDGSLKGSLANAEIAADARLPQASFGEYGAQDLQANVSSAGFDVNAATGPVQVVATADTVTAPEGVQDRFLQGPVRIAIDGALTQDGLTLQPSTATTATASLKVQGTAALNFAIFDLRVTSEFQTSALSAALVPVAGDQLSVSGHVARTPDATLHADNLSVSGGGLSVGGQADLSDQTVSANIDGTLKDTQALSNAFSGAAQFSLTAQGPVDKPDVDLTVDGNDLSINGRKLADLKVEARGTLDPASPSGTVSLSGTLDGQPLSARATVATLDNGERRISGLQIRQGPNAITGDIRLTDAFAPVGTLDVKISDVGPLAALAGQQASGDVTGTVDFSVDQDGTPIAGMDLTSNAVAVAGNTLQNAAIDVRLIDYLGMPMAEGTVTAGTIGAGPVTVSSLDVSLSKDGQYNGFAANARVDGVPVALAGRAQFMPNRTLVELQKLTADIPDAQVSLQRPATVTIENGVTDLSRLALSIGDGSLTAEGSAGQNLDLAAELDAVPAAVANPFVPGVAAAGTLSGTAKVAGTAAAPDATFNLSGQALTTAALQSADAPPASLDVAGRYAGGTLTLQTAEAKVGDGSLTASGSIGETYDLRAQLSDLPVAPADGFVTGLNASGTISGNAVVTGPRQSPDATFQLTGSGITADQIAAAGIAPLSLDVAGRYADGTATLQRARIDVGNGSLSASGTVGRTLDVDLRVSDFPVGLVNGFVPDTQASGTISGTASATGSLTDPSATFDLSGSGITTKQIAQSGTPPVAVRLAGSYADGTAQLQTAVVNVGDGSLTTSGQIGRQLDVDVTLNSLPVGLANGFVDGLDASGTLSGSATASGTLDQPMAEFRLTGRDITTKAVAKSGIAPLDLDASGRFADGTLTLQTARVNVGDGSLTASGTVGQNLDLSLNVDGLPVGLVNGFLPNTQASGTISGTATATGSLSDPQAKFQLSGSGITTQQIAQSGVAPLSLAMNGSYAKGTLDLAKANVNVGDGSLDASGTVGDNLDIKVDVNQIPVGLVNGYVPNIDATGTISGTATATGSLSDPQAKFQLSGSGITTRQIAQSDVAPLSLAMNGSYAKGTLDLAKADVTVGDGSLTASGTVGEKLDIKVDANQIPVGLVNGYLPNVGARGTISGTATATGSLSDPQATFQLSGSGITTRDITHSGVAPLSVDASGSYSGGMLTLADATAKVGAGSLTAKGTVGQTLDIGVDINAIPVGLANGFVKGLGAEGTVSGTASATGSLSSPDAAFDISASGVSVAQTRAAGAPPINATAKGSFRNGTATLETARADVGSGSIAVTGTAGSGSLNVTAEINALPASVASAALSGVAPQGTINGTVRATGSPSSPQVTYDVTASGVSIAQTRAAGVGALQVTTRGQFANKTVTTTTSLSGSGIDLSVNGSVEVAGTPQLNLAVAGTAPLSLANRFLAEGGRQVQGTVRVDARVTGPGSQPAINGTVAVADARFVDTGLNLAVNNISATISLNGETATISSFSATLAGGGRLEVAGTVGLTGDYPANISVRLVNGHYNDGELVSARLGADLTITGPLLGTPLVSGTVNANEIDVLVPEKLPTSLARIDVTHVHARPAVYEQKREITPATSTAGASTRGVDLDITFNAPNRVFVRGRGLDIELGGSIHITGSAASPNIVGGFELQRGRFSILGKRLTFERGNLTFTGNLVPTLDLLAQSTTGDVTVYIAVTGPATDPNFNFSSTPALPQDEVLSRLIFGQGTSNLSPLQIAQLADAAATLAGVGGSTSLLENLRSQIGVDDIDIKTTADGQTAVGVGKYITHNTYLSIDSTGRASVDLDLGSGLKARGAVTTEGGGEVGMFYEGEF